MFLQVHTDSSSSGSSSSERVTVQTLTVLYSSAALWQTRV
jgi:hypothetical protein